VEVAALQEPVVVRQPRPHPRPVPARGGIRGPQSRGHVYRTLGCATAPVVVLEGPDENGGLGQGRNGGLTCSAHMPHN
jgi:hypothetical protein